MTRPFLCGNLHTNAGHCWVIVSGLLGQSFAVSSHQRFSIVDASRADAWLGNCGWPAGQQPCSWDLISLIDQCDGAQCEDAARCR